MRVSVILAVVVGLSAADLLQANPQEEAERRALQRLVSRLPKIDTSSVSCPPFDARFEWKAPNGGYRADFRFRRPDRLEATMTDSTDGGPIALYRDKTVMFFDPSAPKFVIANDYMLDFGLCKGDDGKIAFGARVGFGSEHVQRIQIDLPVVMQAPEGTLTNLASTDSVIRLKQVRGEWWDEVELQMNEPPVCILKTFHGDDPEPQSSMTLTVFPGESPSLFTKPAVERLSKVMTVDVPSKYKPTDGFLGFTAGMQTIAHGYYAIYSHLAFLQPDIRDDMKIPGFSTPDWDTVARHKREFGPKLRDLCGLPAPLTNNDNVPLTPTFAAEQAETLK